MATTMIIPVCANYSIRKAALADAKRRSGAEARLRMLEVARCLVAATRVRCACGNTGDWSESVSGTSGDRPCVWAGCGNCSGQAVGAPVLTAHLREWRKLTPGQRAELLACVVCDGTRAPAAEVDMDTIDSTIDATPCTHFGRPWK